MKGWFRGTLPIIPGAQRFAVRLDGDLYESTWDAIIALYPKLSVGGFYLVDDYGGPDCRVTIEGYRSCNGINEPVQ